MARPSKGGAQINVRLPDDVIEELEEWVEEIRAERPGMSGVTRSDLIRDIVVAALAARKPTKAKAKR